MNTIIQAIPSISQEFFNGYYFRSMALWKNASDIFQSMRATTKLRKIYGYIRDRSILYVTSSLHVTVWTL